MKLAKVVAVRPGNKVDLLFLDNGQRVPGVSVMSGMASSSSGQLGLVTPDAQGEADPYVAPQRSNRDLIACVGFYGNVPVVQGFLYPEISEMIFQDPDRYVLRTASDFVHTVDGSANAEWWHPSGAFIRMGVDTAHDDLKGKDKNRKFNPKRNADKKVHIYIEQAGGTASVDIAPNGKITITSASDIKFDIAGNSTINVGGNVEAAVAGTTKITSGGNATIKAPKVTLDTPLTHMRGATVVDGLFTYKAGMVGSGASGGAGATAKIQGSIEVINGDMTADGVSLKGHVHAEQGDGQDVGKPK